MINFCKKCIMPDSRPRIVFDDKGICNACLYSEEKKKLIGKIERVNFINSF